MAFHVNSDWWKEIFDDIYLQTDARSVCDDNLTKEEVNFIESALNVDKTASILDLCGGQGRHAIELSQRGYTNVVVLDYSGYLINRGIEESRQQNLTVEFVQGDARETELPSNGFQSVMIMGGSFGYFIHEQENQKILNESLRMLNTGGTFLLDLPDKGYVLDNFQPVSEHETGNTFKVTRNRKIEKDIIYCRETVNCPQNGCLRDNTYCIKLYSPQEICKTLEKVGFRNITFQEDFMDRQGKGDYGTMTNRMVVKSNK